VVVYDLEGAALLVANLSIMLDCGSLVYWISKIKVPLSHHKGSGGQVEAF